MQEQILNVIESVTKIHRDELLSKKDENKLWDSLVHVELIIALESKFQIFFETEEISEMTSVTKILTAVERKIQG